MTPRSSDGIERRPKDGAVVEGDEIVLCLSRGFDAAGGGRDREVLMRPARARDEVRALSDFRGALTPERFPAVLLSRVISLAKSRCRVEPSEIERLPASDRAVLEDAYLRLNGYAAGGSTARRRRRARRKR